MPAMTTNVLYWLRASLPGPPGKASADPKLAAIYRAALQQFEELLHAAEVTGYPARPLLLFYALSQAGRAVVASRGQDPASSHGLTVHDKDLLSGDPFEWLVSPTKSGWFQTVAAATDSPGLSGPSALGALIASLPELSKPILREDSWHCARYVEPLPYMGQLRVAVDGSTWLRVGIAIDPDAASSAERIQQLLQGYPILVDAGYRLVTLPGIDDAVVWSPTTGGQSLIVLLHDPDMTKTPERALDEMVPQYRWVGRRWLRPSLYDGEPPPSPLMTWWALLFGLSMLARYHPAEWADALDRQSSTAAAELERTMDLAIEALPHLVLDAVAPQPVLLPPFPEVPPLVL